MPSCREATPSAGSAPATLLLLLAGCWPLSSPGSDARTGGLDDGRDHRLPHRGATHPGTDLPGGRLRRRRRRRRRCTPCHPRGDRQGDGRRWRARRAVPGRLAEPRPDPAAEPHRAPPRAGSAPAVLARTGALPAGGRDPLGGYAGAQLLAARLRPGRRGRGHHGRRDHRRQRPERVSPLAPPGESRHAAPSPHGLHRRAARGARVRGRHAPATAARAAPARSPRPPRGLHRRELALLGQSPGLQRARHGARRSRWRATSRTTTGWTWIRAATCWSRTRSSAPGTTRW